MNTPKRSALFWISLAIAGSCAACTLGMVGLIALGALTADAPVVSAMGAVWIPSGEIARGNGFTQQLPGGRWVYQSGSGLETIKARFSTAALVELSSSGALYEFTFDDGGTYRLAWVNSSNFQGTHRSTAEEQGRWSLQGSTLTLTPESQRALYVANDQSTEKEDVDLAPRSYQLTDITLETVANTGAPMKRFPGVELRGPAAPWDVEKGSFGLDLQRL